MVDNNEAAITKKSVVWTSDLVVKLITAVEEKDVIWNVQSGEYKNRDQRELAWNAIASKINVTKQEANDKWRLLRQQFRNAMKKVNETKSGMASVSKKAPNGYYNAMMFLQPVLSLQAKYRKSNMEIISEAPLAPSADNLIIDDSENTTEYETLDSKITSNASSSKASTSKTSKRKNDNVSYRTAIKKAMEVVNEKVEAPEYIWARYVATIMANHEDKSAVRKFKFQVTRLLEQLEMGELGSSTQV